MKPDKRPAAVLDFDGASIREDSDMLLLRHTLSEYPGAPERIPRLVLVTGGWAAGLAPREGVEEAHLRILTDAARSPEVDCLVCSQAVLHPCARLLGENCRGEEKIRRIAESSFYPQTDWSDSWVYSDSLSDLPLFRLGGHSVAVNPGGGARAARPAERLEGPRMLRDSSSPSTPRKPVPAQSNDGGISFQEISNRPCRVSAQAGRPTGLHSS